VFCALRRRIGTQVVIYTFEVSYSRYSMAVKGILEVGSEGVPL
jgi:hypothetical protein